MINISGYRANSEYYLAKKGDLPDVDYINGIVDFEAYV